MTTLDGPLELPKLVGQHLGHVLVLMGMPATMATVNPENLVAPWYTLKGPLDTLTYQDVDLPNPNIYRIDLTFFARGAARTVVGAAASLALDLDDRSDFDANNILGTFGLVGAGEPDEDLLEIMNWWNYQGRAISLLLPSRWGASSSMKDLCDLYYYIPED